MEWIPITEELPSNTSTVFVTHVNQGTGVPRVARAAFIGGVWKSMKGKNIEGKPEEPWLCNCYFVVVAWQPLPRPFGIEKCIVTRGVSREDGAMAYLLSRGYTKASIQEFLNEKMGEFVSEYTKRKSMTEVDLDYSTDQP